VHISVHVCVCISVGPTLHISVRSLYVHIYGMYVHIYVRMFLCMYVYRFMCALHFIFMCALRMCIHFVCMCIYLYV